MSKALSSDAAIAAIARRQHGNVTRRQLEEAGLSPQQITHRVARGNLLRRYRGVYAVGHIPVSPLSRAAAAVLAAGAGAALGHASAAALWNVREAWSEPLEVTVSRPRRTGGIRIHVCTALTRADLTTHFGIRVVSPARMLLQMALRMTEAELTRAYHDLRLSHHLYPHELEELTGRCHGEPGVTRLRPLLELPGEPTRSKLEDAFVRFLRRYRLPLPEINVVVHGYRVDALYREQALVVELDGERYHRDPQSFESDRRRDADLLLHGLRTVRITTRRLEEEPGQEAARLRLLLGLLP